MGSSENGKDKVKRHALISDIKNGGLRMLDIESLIKTKRIMCLKIFCKTTQARGKLFLEKFFHQLGDAFSYTVISTHLN